MPLSQSPLPHDTAALLLPVALIVATVLTYRSTSSAQDSLFASAAAWLFLCGWSTTRIGSISIFDAGAGQRLAWAAGGLLVLSHVCERAVDGKGLWTKALTPALVYASKRAGICGEDATTTAKAKAKAVLLSMRGQRTSTNLALFTACAVAAIYTYPGSISTNALGLSHAVLQVLAFQLVERAGRQGGGGGRGRGGGGDDDDDDDDDDDNYDHNGDNADQWVTVVRDVAAAATAASTGFATISPESLHLIRLHDYGGVGELGGAVISALGAVVFHVAMFGALLRIILRQSPFLATIAILAATATSQLLLDFSLARLWFAGLCSAAVYLDLSLDDHSPMRARLGRLTALAAALSLSGLALYRFTLSHPHTHSTVPPEVRLISKNNVAPPMTPLEPLQYTNTHVHPIKSLVEDAQAGWELTLRSQSQTLQAAVAEYRRRYGIPPPPHFDQWYAFARRKGVRMIDEYDTIYHSLLPFWALSPSTVRARAREALGFGDNNLMGLLIRNGKVSHVEGGQEWQQQATVGMMEQFVDYLPDMDLPFNIHDEPRVVVPHDELSRLVDTALTTALPAAAANPSPHNAFSPRPEDVTSHGKRIAEVKTTRFNIYAHQPTWIPSRMSCSPHSPARPLEESLAQDNLTAFALGDLGFIYNHTAFSDICNSPSLGHTHGFFECPNSFNVVHDLFPIFSQSKMSSFQDIVYPSPWYWIEKVEYKDSEDVEWAEKKNRLWWRGSTTGGFSRNGGWKRQHRQGFVRAVNGLGKTKVLSKSNSANTDASQEASWKTKEVARQDYKEIMDVHFSHIGQCDPGDCDAQREFFNVVKPAEQQDAWRFKYLLDMDGNAFSGRFYAFLKSKSLPFKMAVFREWHEEWIRPWVHYIPLRMGGGEVLEAVRFLDGEEEGKEVGRRVVERGRRARLGNEDFEVWFFRLLIEWGRIVDERRAEVGYGTGG